MCRPNNVSGSPVFQYQRNDHSHEVTSIRGENCFKIGFLVPTGTVITQTKLCISLGYQSVVLWLI